PCKWWSRNTFSRIASRWGTLLNGEELEEEGYHSNRLCIRTKLKTVVFDSFKIMYRGMTCWIRAIEVPGWVPDFEEDAEEGYNVNDGSHEDDMHRGLSENLKDVEGESDREEVPETNFEEVPDKKEYVPVEKVDNWSDKNRVNDGQEDRDGEVVIMGDFNEVRDISERFESTFNKHGAEGFNSFIVNAGLVEVSLGGCFFTWCHKSAKKMSKLDRFLISDNLMCSCLSISSTSLDRFLSDHRPIIMQEAHYDYGPIPFKFFHYWFELDGFDKLVEHTWLEANVNDQNSYSKFMNKLKYLKEKIRIWARLHKESLNSRKSILKDELANLDGVIDKGEGSDADGHRRREVVR
nr:RNA-directed DNA polymerase, eukaryota [Tanacetum cinerariifolium]